MRTNLGDRRHVIKLNPGVGKPPDVELVEENVVNDEGGETGLDKKD